MDAEITLCRFLAVHGLISDPKISLQNLENVSVALGGASKVYSYVQTCEPKSFNLDDYTDAPLCKALWTWGFELGLSDLARMQ